MMILIIMVIIMIMIKVKTKINNNNQNQYSENVTHVVHLHKEERAWVYVYFDSAYIYLGTVLVVHAPGLMYILTVHTSIVVLCSWYTLLGWCIFWPCIHLSWYCARGTRSWVDVYFGNAYIYLGTVHVVHLLGLMYILTVHTYILVLCSGIRSWVGV